MTRDRLAAGLFGLCAGLVVLATLTIVIVLFSEAFRFFSQVSPWEFLTGTRWTPLFQEKHFGVLPLVFGSFFVAVGAGLLALPTGLLTAIFLSEYAGERLRSIVEPGMEILAAVPTVVYGLLALTFVTPILRTIFPGTEIFNAASAMIVVAVMVLPMVASLSEAALRAVPESLREAAYGLGATKLEVTTRVVVPAGISGVLASFVLALARAFGETMIVTLAAGNSPHVTLNPLVAIQTMTAFIVQAGLGRPADGTIEYGTLFAVGTLLFLLTFAMNLAAQWAKTWFRGREA